MSLLTPEELRQIQLTAELGMTSTVKIQRRTVGTPTVEANDYGDDEVTYKPATKTTTVKGWLMSKPADMPSDENGQIVTVNTYRLVVPVGTDIRAGDRVTIGSRKFTVIDTTAESTWPALLAVSLRGRE